MIGISSIMGKNLEQRLQKSTPSLTMALSYVVSLSVCSPSVSLFSLCLSEEDSLAGCTLISKSSRGLCLSIGQAKISSSDFLITTYLSLKSRYIGEPVLLDNIADSA